MRFQTFFLFYWKTLKNEHTRFFSTNPSKHLSCFFRFKIFIFLSTISENIGYKMKFFKETYKRRKLKGNLATSQVKHQCKYTRRFLGSKLTSTKIHSNPFSAQFHERNSRQFFSSLFLLPLKQNHGFEFKSMFIENDLTIALLFYSSRTLRMKIP